MTRVLVCGLCPLPFENTLRSFGPGIRSWQFARSLANAGHRVHLLAMMIPGSYEDSDAVRSERRDGVDIERLTDEEFFDPARIEARIAELRPEALVGATIYGSNILALTRPKVPFWADQFGHVMAEAQAKACLEDEDWPLPHFWKLLEPVLLSADRLSAVSRRQRFANIGELGVVGRLNSKTCGYELTAVIPCAVVPAEGAPPRGVLRGSVVPEDAFVVLWSGGYNVWTNVDTLFAGLEIALGKNERIHFVSTGGAIEGHDDSTYRDFRDRILGSRHRRRYHLQGWVRAELIPSYQAEADLGVLAEAPIYEGRLGSKNRLVQWMGAGLPVLYNRMGDLGSLLAEKKLGLTFGIGDAAAMAERILWAADHPEALRRTRRRARRYAQTELSFEATTRELVSWAENPSRAPDAGRDRTVLRHRHAFAVERGRVCAVIVHHRGKAKLERCLKTLLDSTGVELEIVVVANACDQQLPEIVETSARVHTVVSGTPLGFAAANNLGAEWARVNLDEHDHYYFIDNDVEPPPAALARLCAALEAGDGAGEGGEGASEGPAMILGAGDRYKLGVDVANGGWVWDQAAGLTVAPRDPPSSRPVLTVTGSALLIDALVLRYAGGWTEVCEYYFEDLDLGFEVPKTGRDPETAAARPGIPSAVDHLREIIARTRDELTAATRRAEQAEARAEQAEARHEHVRREIHLIHKSKMWKLWMAYLAVRRWLRGPFAFLRRS